MTSTSGVSVIVPACNEGGTIGRIVAGIWQQDVVREVIVVDDGSRDDTAAIAEAGGARVIRHPHNIGNGAAIKRGIRHATCEIIVLMDGDGQHDPGDIPRLVSHIGPYDLVVGARTHRCEVSTFRLVGNGLLGAFASYLSGTDIPDLTSGFRAVKRAPALECVPILPNGYSSSTTLTLALLKSGYAVRFVPMDTIAARAAGVSKLRPLRDGLRVLLTIVRVVALFAPLRVFLPASLCLILAGLVALCGEHVGGSFETESRVAIILGFFTFWLGIFADRAAYTRRTRALLARQRREIPRAEDHG